MNLVNNYSQVWSGPVSLQQGMPRGREKGEVLGRPPKSPMEKKPGPLILKTSEKNIRSGIFNLVWVYNEVGGWLLKLRGVGRDP